MEIKRDIYLNKLISKKHNGLIKVVTGIRRCGKSYLLFNMFKDHLLAEGVDGRHIIENVFDSFENKRFRDPDIKGKKYIGTPVKYYFTDLGLRNARLNFRQLEDI